VSKEDEGIARPTVACPKHWTLNRPCYREHAEQIARPSSVASDSDGPGKIARCGADSADAGDSCIDDQIRLFRLKDVVVALALVTSCRTILKRSKIAQRVHVEKTVPQLFQVRLSAEFE
jgi:hypothetical protein